MIVCIVLLIVALVFLLLARYSSLGGDLGCDGQEKQSRIDNCTSALRRVRTATVVSIVITALLLVFTGLMLTLLLIRKNPTSPTPRPPAKPLPKRPTKPLPARPSKQPVAEVGPKMQKKNPEVTVEEDVELLDVIIPDERREPLQGLLIDE